MIIEVLTWLVLIYMICKHYYILKEGWRALSFEKDDLMLDKQA